LNELAGVEVELLCSSGGMIEVTVDGQLKFSKKTARRLPDSMMKSTRWRETHHASDCDGEASV
jgi:predicted Rdx family selenoprotein